MNDPFFIAGLPRSRTAWFSILFTWGNTMCLHDGLYGNDSDALLSYLGACRGEVWFRRGHSCASNLIIYEKIISEFPNSKWVLLRSNPLRVVKSCQVIQETNPDIVMQMDEKLNFIAATNPNAIEIYSETLSLDDCRRAESHIGSPIGSGGRVTRLMDMNIQIHPPILKARLDHLKSQQIVDSDNLVDWSRTTSAIK